MRFQLYNRICKYRKAEGRLKPDADAVAGKNCPPRLNLGSTLGDIKTVTVKTVKLRVLFLDLKVASKT